MNRFEFYSNIAKYENNSNKALKHYGITGQKWGQRRWQNPDGTFNAEGKIRYFGSKKTPEEKEQIRQEKFDKKVNYWVNRQKKEIERYNKNPFHKNKQINIDDDTLKGYYESLWSLPWYKRTHKNAIEEYKRRNNITIDDKDNHDLNLLNKVHDVQKQEEINRINQINQMNQMQQIQQMQNLQQIEQLEQLQQLQQIEQINQINQMNNPMFSGEPSKKDLEAELYKELEALGPNATLADVEKVIRNSNNAKQMQEDWDKENSDMSDYETEKMMNQEGWESKSVPKYNEHSKEKKIVYSKDIDNDEYEGKKFIIEHDDLSDYGVANAINDGNKALSFLNKKGSYQKILNEIADNQYDIYSDVMKDNGKKPVSKSEFIKNEGLKIREIGLDTYDSFNKGNIIIEFDPKPNSDWFGYEFAVWIDPTTGKYIELYQS